MKKYFLLSITVFIISCAAHQSTSHRSTVQELIDNWHNAAAQANYQTYFNLMTNDAVFIGTDASENWNKTAFKSFAKPYFDRGKAWSFTSLERNLYHSNGIYYFDELLDTQMGICRGSGIVKKENGQYKIAHYVLSIAVPNDNVSQLTQLKQDWDKKYIQQLKSK